MVDTTTYTLTDTTTGETVPMTVYTGADALALLLSLVDVDALPATPEFDAVRTAAASASVAA